MGQAFVDYLNEAWISGSIGFDDKWGCECGLLYVSGARLKAGHLIILTKQAHETEPFSKETPLAIARSDWEGFGKYFKKLQDTYQEAQEAEADRVVAKLSNMQDNNFGSW